MNQISTRTLAFAALFLVLVVSRNLSPIASGQESDASKVGKVLWPQWLGPNRDGISLDQDWSEQWPEDGLKVLWKKSIGIGFSSCSVTERRLYTMGHEGGKESVWCLNVDSGEYKWKHSYDCELVDNLYEGGPGATPTIDGERLFTLGKEGQLICFDRLKGNVLWQKDLQEEFDVGLPEWGFNASPLIHDDKLLIQGGRVAAFNKRTGAKLWQTEKHQAGYGSATVFKSGADELVATLDCDGLRIVRLDSGAELDFAAWPSPFRTNSTTPIVRGDLIYISSGYNKGCGMFRWQDGKLQEVYTSRKMRNHFNNSILVGKHLYGFDGNSNLGRIVRLTCMDFATGDVMWQERGFGCGSLIVADNKLLVLSESGDLVLAKTSPDGFTEITRSPLLTGRCWTIPVLAKRRIYARNAAGNLVCAELPAKP